MATKPRTYHGQQVDVTYDYKRCIHAAECVNRLSAVFDRGRTPWANPDEAAADQVADTVMHCPSGALHFERKDGGANEVAPAQNTIQLGENGPLYVHGDITLIRDDETLILDETRIALCRCGQSKNKPFCDNTHIAADFRAAGTRTTTEPVTVIAESGRLTIKAQTNKSLAVKGNFTILDAAGQPIFSGTEQWLCRCGGSSDKPFCDGTHKTNGFQAE